MKIEDLKPDFAVETSKSPLRQPGKYLRKFMKDHPEVDWRSVLSGTLKIGTRRHSDG